MEEDKEIKTYKKEYVLKLLEKNDINLNLVELNLKMLDLLLLEGSCQDLFLTNKYILENLSLSLTYILFNNLPEILIQKFPTIHTIKNLLPEKSLFSSVLAIITNKNLINQKQFLVYNCENKLFSISKFRNFYEKINYHYFLSNNYYQFVSNIIETNKTIKQKQLQEIEYPDEFYDPIMDCVIETPVILPSSKTIMERDVIEKHLLTSNLDPFTRDKLTLNLLNEYNKKTKVIQKVEEFLNKKQTYYENNQNKENNEEKENNENNEEKCIKSKFI